MLADTVSNIIHMIRSVGHDEVADFIRAVYSDPMRLED